MFFHRDNRATCSLVRDVPKVATESLQCFKTISSIKVRITFFSYMDTGFKIALI